MVIDYRKNKLEEQMLTNLYKKTWIVGLKTLNFGKHASRNHKIIARMVHHSQAYNFRVREEEGKTAEESLIANVGKLDPKRHLESGLSDLMAGNILQVLAIMLATLVF